MLKRISDLDYASFEKQIMRCCNGYLNAVDGSQTVVGPWNGDAVFGIQRQIVWNAREMDKLTAGADPEMFLWNDLVYEDGEYPHAGYDNTEEARAEWMESNPNWLFAENGGNFDNGPENSNNMPLVHAAKSLIEVSEYIKDDEGNSNYVSRKLSLLWLFNSVRAVVDAVRTFKWIDVSGDRTEVVCNHTEAESDPSRPDSGRGAHTFYRSENGGTLVVGGNAQFNGEVSTFHSQTRFHGEVRVWDSLNVYGQSYFSKDINGTAMYVRWADLAEYYAADADYEPGTLVKFGGEAEITVSGMDANAVVTTRPGLVLNDPIGVGGHPVAIALVGRVPVKVFGRVKKFDRLYPDSRHPGCAHADVWGVNSFIRALEDGGVEDGFSAVLCAVNFKV